MDSTYAYYSQQQQNMHAEQQQQQQQHQQQFWQPHLHPSDAAGFCASNSEQPPVFNHPFDPKHAPLAVHIAQPPFDEVLFAEYHHQQQLYGQPHPQQQPPYAVYVDTTTNYGQQRQQQPQQFSAQYYAPSPTLSDLSSLSGLSASPLSPPHVLTPMSPPHTHLHASSSSSSALGLGFSSHQNASGSSPINAGLMLPPMPLDPGLDAHMPLGLVVDDALALTVPSEPLLSVNTGVSVTPPAIPSPTAAINTTSTGPAPGEYAVLTLTGHTIAASGSYRAVLSAARSVRKAAESGLGDDSRTCHFCGKVCDRPSTLKTHLNSHTGARPHSCTVPGCNRQFTVLSNMYRHAKVCAAQRAREVRKAVAAARRT